MMTSCRCLRLAGAIALLVGAPDHLAGQIPGARDSLRAALVELVLAHHPELLLRRAAVHTSRARLLAAGPRDAATLSAEIEDIPDGVNLPDAGQMRLMVERDFLTGGRRAAERTVARTAEDVALMRLALAERSVAAVVRGDLALWGGWHGVADRLGAEDALLQEATNGLEARFATGEARYVDVLRLRTERLRVRSARAEALRAAQEGRRRLEGLVMPDDPAAARLAELLRALAAASTESILSDSLPPPPDLDSLLAASGALRLGELAVERAGAEATRLRASRGMQLTGGLGVQRFGDATGGYTVGPSLRAALSLPFTVRGSTKALRQLSELSIAEARADRAVTESRLRTMLWLARDRYVAALERVQVHDAALLTGAREEREGALGAYRSGELSLLELLDFERALSRAETDGVRAVIDAQVALAQLYSTAAGLTVSPTGLSETEAGHD